MPSLGSAAIKIIVSAAVSLHKLAIGGAIVMAILIVVIFAIQLNPMVLVFEVVMFAALYIWLWIFYPRSRSRSKYRELSQAANGTPRRTTTFYGDFLRVEGESGETQVAYSDISRIQTSETLVILYCPEERAIILDRDGFEGHTEHQVLERIGNYSNASL